MTRFSLKNRALIALITVVASVFGYFALTGLKQELIPEVTLPQVAVFTRYPGATPEVVDAEISQLIESSVRGIAGLESTSTTSSSSSSIVVASFDYSVDLVSAEQKVQVAVNRLRNALPTGVDPLVFTGSMSDLPVLQIAASSDDRTELVRRLELNVIPDLEKIDGVREVSLVGATGQRITITPDNAKLAMAGATVNLLSQALATNGVLIPAGSVISGENKVYVQVGNRLDGAQSIRNLPLLGAAPGTLIQDVAKVELVDDPITSISRVNGDPAVTLSITKTPDANTVSVSNLVKTALVELKDQLGGGKFTVVFDQAPFIEQSIETLAIEGLLGLIFAILVILLFLMSVRATLVTAVSIPVSVLITLVGIQSAGYTLNILTLGALTIAIGRVVDDSIVVIENIKRHLVESVHKATAIATAVREVAAAITASTITTVAVFLPIGLVGGMSGELFRPFALTVAISLLASLLVALTIIPVLAYWWIKPAHIARYGNVKRLPEPGESEESAWLEKLYLPVLRSTLKWPAVTLLVAVLILGGTGALMLNMKTNFIGDTGQNTMSVSQTVSSGTDLAKQAKLAELVEDELLSIDGIEVVQSSIGQGTGMLSAFMGGGSPSISYSITTGENVDQAELQNRVRTQLEQLDVGAISVTTGSAGGGFSSDITVNVTGPDFESITAGSETLLQKFAELSSVKEVSSNVSETQPQIQISVNRTRATELGLTEAQIGQMVSRLVQPTMVGKLQLEGDTISVYVQTQDAPTTLAELSAVELAPGLALSDVASVTEAESPSTITGVNGRRNVAITVAIDANDLGTITGELTEVIEATDLPAGVSAGIGGVAADQEEAFSQLGLALLAAILIVYVVMVATFRSLRQPLLLLISVPFAATGAIAMLLITDTPLGVPALIGVLMLIGIVVTNAIVMVDLVNQYRDRGLGVKDAVIHGAARRFRPILMTALATIFALTPMASGVTGHGGFISQPLALVVIGGLVSSTALTLIVLPSLYWFVEGAKERRIAKRANAAAGIAAPGSTKKDTSRPEITR